MNDIFVRKLIGWGSLFFGAIIILISLGDFIVKLCIGFAGLSLLNYGLGMLGQASVQSRVSRMVMYRRWW